MQLTGHPFVDAGIAGIAALLESEFNREILSPAEITENDLKDAINILKRKYYFTLIKKEPKKVKKPLFYFLLQEVLPGSSWDQVKTGNVVESMKKKFENYINRLLAAASEPPIGKCAFTGQDAHITIGKSEIPMLASVDERPNSYPNLCSGLQVNSYIALAILFSPIGIEKTINEKGKGGLNIIYQTHHWRFAVSIAKRNLTKLRILLAANSIEEFRKNYFRELKRGSWKITLLTLMHALNDIPQQDQPQTVLWSFNAINQGGRYDSHETADSFVELHNKRFLYPTAYRQLVHCSDHVSKLILEGKSIARASVLTFENKRTKNKIENTILVPNWFFQRFYAQEVLNMPARLLNAIEKAATSLAEDTKAVNYCLFEKIRPHKLTSEFKVASDVIAIFSDYHDSWRDYLRAAVLWASKGNKFSNQTAMIQESPGEFESIIIKVCQKLCEKHHPKRLAMRLSVRSIAEYRSNWIGLLRDGACEWKDFLTFNPLDEAFSLGNYSKTKILRDYLVAYLFGLSANPSFKDRANAIDSEVNVDIINFDEPEQLEEQS